MENLRHKIIAAALGATGSLTGLAVLSRCAGGACGACFGCAGAGVALVLAGVWSGTRGKEEEGDCDELA
jgi:hypothetical protein